MDWLALGLPVALACAAGGFLWMRRGVTAELGAGPGRIRELPSARKSAPSADIPSRAARAIGVLGTFATVVLWTTESWRGLSTGMSNTAAANILLPIALAMVHPEAGREGELLMGASAALGCSLGMALPISTPPNALVLAGGGLRSRDYLPLGVLYLVLGPPLVVAWCSFWLSR